jgi:tetratricopeptide (TPR) repeat protein
VLDAGATESGRPYFVMELVKGVPITQFCDDNRLPPRERLELFVTVCQAVQHAHQKGIIHRDIKPPNVLVTLHDGTPVVKVIDFGIAKAIGQHLTERTVYTRFMQMIGSPLYMSPEQAQMSGLDIDTRTDIYALGVLLYELLTGTTPLEAKRLREAGYAEMQRLIREEEPPRPSTRLSSLGDSATLLAGNRGTDPKQLARLLAGDLDWIVLKALNKDRNRRYGTPGDFAEDVERYLRHEAILARPPSTAYKLRKFAQRNRAAVLTVAVVVVALLGGTAIATWQAVRATLAERDARMQRDVAAAAAESEAAARDRADKAAATAEAINNFLLNDILAALAPTQTRGRKVTVEELLRKAAVMAGQAFPEQPEFEAAARHTIGTTYRSLGLNDAAYPQLLAAVDIRRGVLGGEHPHTLSSMDSLAGLLFSQDKTSEAELLARKVLASRLRVLGEEHVDTLHSMYYVGFVLRMRQNFAEAEPLIRKALETQRRLLGEKHPDTLQSMGNLAQLLMGLGKLEDAESVGRQVLDLQRQVLGEDHPETLLSMNSLAHTLSQQRKHSDAELLHRKALELRRRVLGEEHPATLLTRNGLTGNLLAQGKWDEAEPVARETLSLQRRVMGPEHRHTVTALHNLARIWRRQGKLAEAEPLYADVLEIRRRKPEGSPNLDTVLAELGHTLLGQQKYAQAEPLLRECLALREQKGPEWWMFHTTSMLGGSLAGQKKFADAEPLLLQGYEGMKQREAKIPAIGRLHLTEALERLVHCYDAWGKRDQATEWRKKLEAHKKQSGVEKPEPETKAK